MNGGALVHVFFTAEGKAHLREAYPHSERCPAAPVRYVAEEGLASIYCLQFRAAHKPYI